MQRIKMLTPLDIFSVVRRRVPSPLLAALSFVIITAGILFLLSNAMKYLPAHTANSSNNQSEVQHLQKDRVPAPSPLQPVSPVIAHPDPNRESNRLALSQKLEADTHRLEILEAKRRSLSKSYPAPARETAAADASNDESFSSEHKTRRDLVAELILLLKLEKQDKSESSEIVAVRHKITRLQLELSQADSKAASKAETNASAAPSPDDSQSTATQLAGLRYAIAASEANVLADQRELASLLSPATQTGIITPAENSAPQSATPRVETHPISDALSKVPNSVWLLVVGIALGGLISFAIMKIPVRPDLLVRDEATLQGALINSAEFIGSIPRMKA
jgi:hypothetical protein